METGESGANGAHVQRHANKESNQEHVNVIHQFHSTVEKLVWENARRLESAMTMFLVQVSCALVYILTVVAEGNAPLFSFIVNLITGIDRI